MKALLLAGAIAASAIAICAATSVPGFAWHGDLPGLARAASVILWLAYFATRNHRLLADARADLADARAEVDEIRRHTNIEERLRAAGAGSDFALPTPRGDVRAVPADVDGQTVLAGIDESAALANVIDLRRAMSDSAGKAAQ